MMSEVLRKPPLAVTQVMAHRERYLRTTIPKEIIDRLKLIPGDKLAWLIHEINGEKVIILRIIEKKPE